MPNRIIKESTFTSDKIASLSDFEFRLWVGLITYVDDAGRGDARPAIIRGRLFSLRERVTLKDIDDALHGLAAKGCVSLYTVGGKPYFWFPTWSKHQRIRDVKPKYPSPEESDGQMISAADCGELPQVAADCRRLRPESESNPNTNPNTKKDDVDDAREERHDLGTVMTLYMDHIQANPPPVHIDTLKSYTESMGAEVVEHAITKALDANALNFSYVRTVLQGYAAKKVTTLAQAKQVDQAFLEGKQRGKGYGLNGKNAPASCEPQKVNLDDLRSYLEKI